MKSPRIISLLYYAFRHAAGRVWSVVNPRAIAWAYLTKKYPHKTLIVKLDKNLKARVYTHDVIGESIFVKGVFEKAESAFVTRFLKQGMVFFDIGANFGLYTLLAAKRVGKEGQVHSFEPSNRMFSELKFNVRLNDMTTICKLNNIAVSNKEGTAQLTKYEPGAEVYGSLCKQRWPDNPIIGYEEIQTITLDNYVYTKLSNINHIDLIKMDIEGAELLALMGAKRLLSQKEAPVIVLEIVDKLMEAFKHNATDLWRYLEKFGYRMYNFDNNGQIKDLCRTPTDRNSRNVIAMK